MNSNSLQRSLCLINRTSAAHRSCKTFIVDDARVASKVDQLLDDVRVAAHGREMQRRRALCVDGVRVRAVLEQQLNHFGVTSRAARV